MDRERRDRHGSPSRASRAALLSSIAQRRAEKHSSSSLAAPIRTPHSIPLPDSDESDSDHEEFSTPEGKESSLIAPSQVLLGGSRLGEQPDVHHDGDGLSGILDSLGDLSIESNKFGSHNSSNAGFHRLQKTNATVITTQQEQTIQGIVSSGSDGGHWKPAGSHFGKPVDLSSDDEDDFQRGTIKLTEKSVDPSINVANSPSKTNVVHHKSETGIAADVVLGEGKLRYVLQGTIATKLYTHQQSGIRWLWGLHIKKMGGILGDDMGLGKTMQIASFFAGLLSSKLIRTAMVVAPKTLISHWVKELASVGLSRKTYSFIEPSARVREHALHRVLQAGGVLLTTYDMVRCNWKSLRGDLHGRDGYGDNSDDITTWDYLVLDEGHLIKNPNTERAKSLREIPSTHRIIISGTPIQNNLKEMWALMDFCCPGLLGDQKEFKKKYESQIVAGNDKYASDRMKRLGAAVAQELRDKIAPFFLRRMKSEVFPEEAEGVEVPKLSRKNDLIVWLQLTTRQEKLYRAFLESDAVRNALDGSNALTALSVLKKICDHPSLLTKRAAEDIAEGMEGLMGDDDRAKAEAMIESLAGLAESSECGESKGAVSCKIVFLLTLMEILLNEGHRTLIFSQTRKMLNIIQEEIEDREWEYRRIDGTMKSSDREMAVQDFQSRPYIPFFLLTSQVGGLGLTLTAADRVVIIDPAWNPSMDNQSVDRAYRIGQKKDVTVYRLMTCGTLEEKIYRKQVFKGGLMKIATETKNQMRYFSKQDLRELFHIPATGFSVSVTQKQLAEEHFGEHRTTSEVEEHIRYLEGLSMIAGVSHHDLLYSKAAPALPPAQEGEDDANVKWEARNVAYHQKSSQPASRLLDTPTWDQATSVSGANLRASAEIFDEAKHAWLRTSFFKDKIKRLAATLEDEGMMSKLSDGGAKIMAKIKELNAEVEKLKLTAALYEDKISREHRPKRDELSSNGTTRAQLNERDVDVRKAAAVPVTAEGVVRVRSASGNNIYNTARVVATELRKSPTQADTISGLGALDDALSSLRV